MMYLGNDFVPEREQFNETLLELFRSNVCQNKPRNTCVSCLPLNERITRNGRSAYFLLAVVKFIEEKKQFLSS